MAGIQTTLSIADRMTAPIMSINNAINDMQKSFAGVKTVADITPQSLTVMKNQVDMANAAAELLNQNFNTVKNSVENASDSQRKFNETIQKAHTPIDGLIGKIGAAVTAYASIQGIKAGVGWIKESISMTNQQIQAEQQLANVLANQGTTEAEFIALKQKALSMQGTTMYDDTLMIGAAGELATYISDGEALQHMMGTVANYAAGMSGGAELSYTQMVDYATQLGKALDGTYDGLSKKGFTLSDTQKEIIENGTDMQKAMVLDEVINQSWAGLSEQMANTPQGIMTSMQNTFNDIRSNIGAQLLPSVMTIFTAIQENMPIIEQAISYIVPAIQFVIGMIGNIVGALGYLKEPLAAVHGWFAGIWNYISNNWSKIAPIINVIAGALAALVGAFLLYKAAVTIAAIAQGIFNMALWTSPLTWVIIIIIAIIAALYFVVDIINKVAGTSVSATGIIFGSFAVLGAFLWDLFLGLLELVLGVINYLINPFINIANFIGNVFQNPVSSIIYLFQGMADNVLALLQKIASALDFVFGSNMAEAVQGWRNTLKGMADAAVAEYAPNENYEKVVDNLNLSVEGLGLKRWAYGDAWDAGYAAGENLEAGINDFDPSSFFTQNEPPATASDFVFSNFDGIGHLPNIDANTKATADYSEEELKLWRDIAERDTINRFTTASVNLDFGGITQNVGSDADLDGIINYIAEGLGEALLVTAEGANA